MNSPQFSTTPLIHQLDESFFAGMRNTVTPQALKKLAEFAKTIPEPKIFGKYESESHYMQTLELMLGSTNETRRFAFFIKKHIFPILKSYNNFLDIGPGNGQLTNWIGNKFNCITVVDVNKKIIEALKINKKIRLEKIHTSICDTFLKKDYYDLTLMSHVLYYVERSMWVKAITLAYRATRYGGVCVIALSGELLNKARIIKAFGGELIDINALIKQCRILFGESSVSVFTSNDAIVSKSLLSMLHIGGFFLYDAGASAKKDELKSFIQAHCRKENKIFYEISSQQSFIVLRK